MKIMKIDKRVEKELNATGRPWTVKQSKRHKKLFIDGKLVGILPHDGKLIEANGRGAKNIISQIRRAGQHAQ